MLHGVINGRQSAFMGGRNLLHNTLVGNEVVDEAKRKMRKCLLVI